MKTNSLYTKINRKSWTQLLAENEFRWRPPFTIHLPVQPYHAPTFVFIDGAFNALCLPVVPRLSVRDAKGREAARTMKIGLVQFAFGDPPFVPDFHHTKISLRDGRYPLAALEYFAQDLLYCFEYFCRPLGSTAQSILWIRGTVTNEAARPAAAHVRARLNLQRECDVMDYHYRPFCWDASRWLPCRRAGLEGNSLALDGTVAGKIDPSGFDARREKRAGFRDAGYNLGFGCESPYVVAPAMRLKRPGNSIHLSASLLPGQARSFSLAVLTDIFHASPAHRALLKSARHEPDRKAAIRSLEAPFRSGKARMICTAGNWDKIFTALQASTLQLLVQFPGEKGLTPLQGGSSERHFVWVWEAVCMLQPMLPLGHFEAVRKALDFIFSLQDGGCPPEGRLTTTRGAIGTTGPRWLNTTGAALFLAADYYRFSKDRAYLKIFLPKMFRAAEWILGEIRAARRLNTDGSRPATCGLMPFGHATDGDIGHVVTFTDAYTFRGLWHFTELLEALRHPRAAECRRELEQYRADILRAVSRMTLPDGFIERRIKTGEAEKIFSKSEHIAGGITLAYTGVLDVRGRIFARYMDCFERKHADGYFLGKMDRDIVYIGLGELEWQDAYLKLGEWKKGWAALQAYLKYGLSQDAFQVQERFSKSTPEFTPWQPNGSGNGRALEMMVKSFYFEHGGAAAIFGGIPFEWLAMNGATAIENLHTPRGALSLRAEMSGPERCRVQLTGSKPGTLPARLLIPGHFSILPVPSRKKYVEVPGGRREVTITLARGSS